MIEKTVSSMLCPRCGENTHRSHTRGFREKLVKRLTLHKTYRCHECGWRGWLKPTTSNNRHVVRTIISLIVTLVLTTLLAVYVVEKLSATTPIHVEQSPTQ